MINFQIFKIGIVFLDYSQFDGDDEGGSIIELIETLGEIWWPLIGFILLVLMLRDVFSKLFSKGGIFDFSDDNYLSKNATIEERQIHADRHFENMKKYKEKGWHTQKVFYLEKYSKLMAKKNELDFLTVQYKLYEDSEEISTKSSINEDEADIENVNFDITNLAAYSNHLERNVFRESKNKDGYIILKEYWTYDGKWRQGYWTGKYDKSDPDWRKNTKCDYLDTTQGDIHPDIYD